MVSHLYPAYRSATITEELRSCWQVTPQNRKFNEGHLNKLFVERKPRRSLATIRSSRKN
jgi:hypothetical protein